MQEKTTGNLLETLKSTHSKAELDRFIKMELGDGGRVSFSAVFEGMLEAHGIAKSEAIKRAMLDRTYGYQILSGMKRPGRNKILALAIGCGLSLKETTRLLEAAEEGILYVKSPRDARIIYGIEHGLSLGDINLDLHEAGEEIIE